MARSILYLIDGHAVAYRQYFGKPLSGFSTKSGEPTNAIFGFTQILITLLQKTKPDYIAVTFDKGLSGRDVIYADYKGTRDKMPSELASQIDRIYEVVEAFNIPILALDGYEADDVIGTVVTQAEALDIDVHIITGDGDLLQLLCDYVTVQLPSRSGPDHVYDVKAFIEKYSIRPDQLVDMKALMGDSSDNIPGVKGIGEKTAVKFLLEYETLENLYDHIDQIKGTNQRKLKADRELAFISQELARIQRDVPVKLELEACVAQDYNLEDVMILFRELEFRSLSSRLMEDVDSDEQLQPLATAESDESIETIVVDDEIKLKALIDTLNEAQSIVWDVETTGIDQMQADLVGIALAVNNHVGYYIPIGHKAEGAGTLFEQPVVRQLSLEKVVDALKVPLTDPKIPKYAHNAAYDMVVMSRYGIDVYPVAFDTMIAEWLREPISKHLGLKNLANHELGFYMTPITELIGKGKKQTTMDRVSVADAAPYAAADAVITHRLVHPLQKDLDDKHLLDLYHSLEMPFVPVVVALEQAGVVLDVDYLADMSQRLAEQLADLQEEIYNLSEGHGQFNINSPKQLNDMLFDKLRLATEGLKKTTHGYSTDVTTLEKLKEDTNHPILSHILEYRELTKLKGTYVDALPELINPNTGRVHTSYNQTGTATGRLSSSNPNLQNIPIRTEIGREVRRAFIAPQGKCLLAVDYSQIELRVLAHISRDETLMQAFREGQDIHAATAAAVYGLDLNDITYDQRSFAKRVNFGLIYGMGKYRLARDSDLTLAEAESFIDRYFDRLPGVKRYLDDSAVQVIEKGFTETLFGRRRNFPALKNASSQSQTVQAEKRAAINMPIQGTAADIMKKALIDLHSTLGQHSYDVKMILQVHDEVVLEVAVDEVDQVKKIVVNTMEAAYSLDVPLKANAEVGFNWRDMEIIL